MLDVTEGNRSTRPSMFLSNLLTCWHFLKFIVILFRLLWWRKAFGDIPAVPEKVLIIQGEKVLYHVVTIKYGLMNNSLNNWPCYLYVILWSIPVNSLVDATRCYLASANETLEQWYLMMRHSETMQCNQAAQNFSFCNGAKCTIQHIEETYLHFLSSFS